MPLSVFAAGTCTCENRCSLNDIDANCTVCTESDYSGCMGTPELVENGSPWRLSDSTAEVNFMATVNPNITWKYFYIVTNDATIQPAATEIITSGASGEYSDPCTLVLDNLAEGEKYIHIVLNQAEQGRTTNVLRLTIPAFVELTLTPSANGGNYDAATNTLTIAGGGVVNFTLNVPGYVHCDNDETIEATPVGDDLENATEWTVTLPATPKTYTFYYALSGQTAECTVVVEFEILPTTYTLRLAANGGIGEDIIINAVSGDYLLPENPFTAPDGKVFIGWSESKFGSDLVDSDTYNVSEDRILYAFWEDVEFVGEFGSETTYRILNAKERTVELASYDWFVENGICYFNVDATVEQNDITYKIVSIGDDAFKNTTIDRISFTDADNLEAIGANAFNGCSKIKSIIIPDTVSSVGDGAFKNCPDLASATIYYKGKKPDFSSAFDLDATEVTYCLTYLSAPTNLHWDTSNGTVATWDAVDGAANYIAELYKKDIITLHLLSHVVSDTSFDYDLTSLSPGSYYFTVRAVTEDIKSNVATSDNIIMTSGGTPIVIGGVSVSVDSIDGTTYIVGRDDIANGSVSDVNMTPITVSITLTNEQAVELINGWITSWEVYPSVDTYKDYIRPQLEDYSLADLEVIRNNIDRGMWPNDFIADVVIEEIESREATDLVIAPGYIDSTSDFKVTTGQGLGVTYGNEALGDVLASVGTDSNVMVATKFEKAEITRDEASIIVAAWAEIVNTAEGEEQIKNLLTNYSIYELALLQQYTNILVLDDSTAQKLYELMRVERDKKKEEAAAKDNEEPLATFSVNTYAVAADGTQTYIPVKNSMQYAIPVDTSNIPENATLALYRVNEDGTRTKQEILSVSDGLVIAQTDGNSDYVLVYELAEEHTHSFEWVIDKEATETEDGIKHEECACGAKQNENTVITKTGTDNLVPEPEVPNGLSTGAIVAIVIACVVVLAGGGFALYWFVFKKKKV